MQGKRVVERGGALSAGEQPRLSLLPAPHPDAPLKRPKHVHEVRDSQAALGVWGPRQRWRMVPAPPPPQVAAPLTAPAPRPPALAHLQSPQSPTAGGSPGTPTAAAAAGSAPVQPAAPMAYPQRGQPATTPQQTLPTIPEVHEGPGAALSRARPALRRRTSPPPAQAPVMDLAAAAPSIAAATAAQQQQQAEEAARPPLKRDRSRVYAPAAKRREGDGERNARGELVLQPLRRSPQPANSGSDMQVSAGEGGGGTPQRQQQQRKADSGACSGGSGASGGLDLQQRRTIMQRTKAALQLWKALRVRACVCCPACLHACTSVRRAAWRPGRVRPARCLARVLICTQSTAALPSLPSSQSNASTPSTVGLPPGGAGGMAPL